MTKKEAPHTPKLWCILNSPLFLTLIGTIALTVVTTWWQSRDSAIQRKSVYHTALATERLSSIQKLYSTHYSFCQIKDARFYLEISYLKDRKQKSGTQSLAKKIKYRKDIEEHHKKIEESRLPISDAQVLTALFPSSEVSESVKIYEDEFRKSLQLSNELAAYINDGEGLDLSIRHRYYQKILIPETISEYSDQRKKMDAALRAVRNSCFNYLAQMEDTLDLGLTQPKSVSKKSSGASRFSNSAALNR